MPKIQVRLGENLEVALRRFKRACEKAGILTEHRRRESFEKPSAKRKRQHLAAVKRYKKKILREFVGHKRKG